MFPIKIGADVSERVSNGRSSRGEVTVVACYLITSFRLINKSGGIIWKSTSFNIKTHRKQQPPTSSSAVIHPIAISGLLAKETHGNVAAIESTTETQPPTTSTCNANASLNKKINATKQLQTPGFLGSSHTNDLELILSFIFEEKWYVRPSKPRVRYCFLLQAASQRGTVLFSIVYQPPTHVTSSISTHSV